MVTTLTGAALGFEASTLFIDEGNRPRLGHAFLVIDPGALSGPSVYDERIETLIATMTAEAGVRLPGERREALATKAAADGVEISLQLHEQLIALAG